VDGEGEGRGWRRAGGGGWVGRRGLVARDVERAMRSWVKLCECLAPVPPVTAGSREPLWASSVVGRPPPPPLPDDSFSGRGCHLFRGLKTCNQVW
jgi:hypothetical protein